MMHRVIYYRTVYTCPCRTIFIKKKILVAEFDPNSIVKYTHNERWETGSGFTLHQVERIICIWPTAGTRGMNRVRPFLRSISGFFNVDKQRLVRPTETTPRVRHTLQQCCVIKILKDLLECDVTMQYPPSPIIAPRGTRQSQHPVTDRRSRHNKKIYALNLCESPQHIQLLIT